MTAQQKTLRDKNLRVNGTPCRKQYGGSVCMMRMSAANGNCQECVAYLRDNPQHFEKS